MVAQYKLEVDTKPPLIPTATITAAGEAMHRHKNRAAVPEFGEVYLKIEPQESRRGF